MNPTKPKQKRPGTRKAYPVADSRFASGARTVLLATARRGETVTYGTLMRRYGLSRGRPLTAMISAVDHAEYKSNAPGFAAIIVRKDTGYPGGGYFCDNTLPTKLRRPQSRSGDPRMSAAEREYISRKQKEIWMYYRGVKSSARP